MSNHNFEDTLAHVNTYSNPSELRITDMKVVDTGRPFSSTIVKIMTNQGIEGYGQTREGGSRVYATMLKRLILGENPCNVDMLFRRMKQFGHHSHQGGGVSAIEMALWDLAGKAYGVPVWQMLGGKFRDKIRIYCDTDVHGRHEGKTMGEELQKRIKEKGYTFMKMDLSADEILLDIPGAMTCPGGYLDDFRAAHDSFRALYEIMRDPNSTDEQKLNARLERRKKAAILEVPGPFSSLHITDYGFEILEEYVRQVREVIGYSIPLATDHFGHIGVNDCIKLAQHMEKFNLAWLEDMVPWHMTDQLAEIQRNSTTPLCTGEDIYLKENFLPLFEKHAVQIIHPDLASTGGIYETKKIGDMAQDYGVPMALHMNESPIAAMACVQVAAATENFLVMEFHHNDYPDWPKLVKTKDQPIVQNGFIRVPDEPGLGIESIDDELLAQYIGMDNKGPLWDDTDEWNHWQAIDRLWL